MVAFRVTHLRRSIVKQLLFFDWSEEKVVRNFRSFSYLGPSSLSPLDSSFIFEFLEFDDALVYYFEAKFVVL